MLQRNLLVPTRTCHIFPFFTIWQNARIWCVQGREGGKEGGRKGGGKGVEEEPMQRTWEGSVHVLYAESCEGSVHVMCVVYAES